MKYLKWILIGAAAWWACKRFLAPAVIAPQGGGDVLPNPTPATSPGLNVPVNNGGTGQLRDYGELVAEFMGAFGASRDQAEAMIQPNGGYTPQSYATYMTNWHQAPVLPTFEQAVQDAMVVYGMSREDAEFTVTYGGQYQGA